MKTQTTKKYINALYKNKIEIPYADLQTVLEFIRPDYYTCGVYGWNSDIYIYDSDTVIITGYRPFGNIKPKHDLIRKYEETAQKLRNTTHFEDIQTGKLQKKLSELLDKFIDEVRK